MTADEDRKEARERYERIVKAAKEKPRPTHRISQAEADEIFNKRRSDRARRLARQLRPKFPPPPLPDKQDG